MNDGSIAIEYLSSDAVQGLPFSEVVRVGNTAGAAALTVPPLDEDALVDSLRLLIEQPRLRAELRRRGLAHAARFSWRRCAEETLAVYDRVLSMTRDS